MRDLRLATHVNSPEARWPAMSKRCRRSTCDGSKLSLDAITVDDPTFREASRLRCSCGTRAEARGNQQPVHVSARSSRSRSRSQCVDRAAFAVSIERSHRRSAVASSSSEASIGDRAAQRRSFPIKHRRSQLCSEERPLERRPHCDRGIDPDAVRQRRSVRHEWRLPAAAELVGICVDRRRCDRRRSIHPRLRLDVLMSFGIV